MGAPKRHHSFHRQTDDWANWWMLEPVGWLAPVTAGLTGEGGVSFDLHADPNLSGGLVHDCT